MKKQKTLKDFIEEKNITMAELADVTGISIAQLHLIAKDPKYNVTVDTMKKIMKGTEEKFNKALMPWDYLSGWKMKL